MWNAKPCLHISSGSSVLFLTWKLLIVVMFTPQIPPPVPATSVPVPTTSGVMPVTEAVLLPTVPTPVGGVTRNLFEPGICVNVLPLPIRFVQSPARFVLIVPTPSLSVARRSKFLGGISVNQPGWITFAERSSITRSASLTCPRVAFTEFLKFVNVPPNTALSLPVTRFATPACTGMFKSAGIVAVTVAPGPVVLITIGMITTSPLRATTVAPGHCATLVSSGPRLMFIGEISDRAAIPSLLKRTAISAPPSSIVPTHPEILGFGFKS